MNGLRFIRTHCNLSLNELAKEIGVSRQAVSAWEKDAKRLPDDRAHQLAELLGVEKRFFGEISEEDKTQLLEKAMFRYYREDKEYYKYKPHNNNSLKDEIVCFLGDSMLTLDEEYAEAIKSKREVLQKAEEMITYRKEKSKKSEITSIKRGTKIYGAVNTLLEGMPKQKLEMRMPYWQELNNVLNALLLAYGLVDDEKIKEEYHFLNMIDFDNDDMLWTLNLAHMLKRRWEEKQPLKGKPNAKMCLTNGKRDVTISVVDLIKYMEEENRQFWEDNPEMAYKTGMQFRPDI